MAAYKHIIFDLDHTLWDFESNCTETILELYPQFSLEEFTHFTPMEFIETYKNVNQNLWNAYHKGLIDKNTLRTNRFEKTFEKLGIPDIALSKVMNEAFTKVCPTKKNLLPYTIEILDYLKEKYSLHILTNGFKDSQHIKITSSGIAGYFLNVFNPEGTGFSKPDKKMFDYTLAQLSSKPEECIMIGDDLDADVLGAKNAGIDHVFYNREGSVHDEDLTYEIKCLSELKNFL